MSGTPHRPRSMMWFALAVALVIGLLMLAGCVRPGVNPTGPVTTITFLGTGVPDKTGVFITIDMTFAPGVTSGGTVYPHEWVDTVPFSHHQAAQKGTVTSYLFTIHATEPGQVVECVILFNGNAAKPIDHHKATYPKPAVCSGPPV